MKMLLKKFSKMSGITSLVVHIKSGNPYAGPMPRYPDSLQRSTTLGSCGGSPTSHTVFSITLSGLANFNKKVTEVFGGRSVIDGNINRHESATGGAFGNHSPRIGFPKKRKIVGRKLDNAVSLVSFRKQITGREATMKGKTNSK